MGCGASTSGPPMDPHAPLGRSYSDAKYDAWKKSNAAKKLAAALATEEGRGELHTLFNSLDVNTDGKVTAEEWASGLSKQPHLLDKYFGGVTQSENAEIFKKLDTNGDKGLDWDEFIKGAQSILESTGL